MARSNFTRKDLQRRPKSSGRLSTAVDIGANCPDCKGLAGNPLRQVEAGSVPPLHPLEAGLRFFLGDALVVVAVDDFRPRQLMGAVELLPAGLVRLEIRRRRPGLGDAETLCQLLLAVLLLPLGFLNAEPAQDFLALFVGGPKAEVGGGRIAQDGSNRIAAGLGGGL